MPETDRANDLLYAGNRVQVSTPLQAGSVNTLKMKGPIFAAA